MRCASYMRRDSCWRDEHCDYHKPTKHKKGDYGYYDLDGDLIAQQREHIRSYAAELGWEIDEEYIDIEGTAEYKRLKKDCENGKYDRVITDSIYRFSGDMVEAKVALQEVFIPVGIQVAVAQDRYCSAISTKNETGAYFKGAHTRYMYEGVWLKKYGDGAEQPGEKQPGKEKKEPQETQPEIPQVFNGPPVLGSKIHDGETGEVLRYYGIPEKGVLFRNCDKKIIRWNVPCPAVQFDTILDFVMETLRREKAAADWAKENIFSEDAEEEKARLLAPLRIRAEKLVKETDILLSRRLENRANTDAANSKIPNSEAPDKDAPDPETQINVSVDVDCAHKSRDDRRLIRINEEFSRLMEEAGRIETAYSLKNPWIKRFAGIDLPEEISRWHIQMYIGDIRVYGMGNGKEYRVEVIVRHDDFRALLPDSWYSELVFSIAGSLDDMSSPGTEDPSGTMDSGPDAVNDAG